jgi:Na+/melibiose symporter-like transporter
MMSLVLGSGCSYAISGSSIGSTSTKSDVGALMIIEASITCLSFLLILSFFREKPSSQHEDNTNKAEQINQSIKSDVIKLFKNKNYIYLLTASSVSIGTINYISVVIETITNDLNYSSEQATVLGLCAIVFGMIGIIVSSIISSALNKFKIICIVSLSASMITTASLYYTLETQPFYVSIIVTCVLGLFFMQIFALGLELGSEISYPINEIISSGLINCFGGLFSVVPILLAYALGNNALSSMIIAITFFGISLLFMILVKEELNRKNAEESSN